MARPTKQGIDYFPLDTEFDDDLQLLIAEIGADGLGILITIWQATYKGNGYYISSDKKFPLKIKQKCFSSVEKIINVVENAIDYEIFDKGLYKKYNILTSRGLQKRYFTAARNKKQVEIIPQYALIDVSNIENAVDVVINEIDVGGNATKEKEEVKVKEKDIRFSNFWKTYPKKKSKGTAEKAFIKINPEEALLSEMITAVESAKKTPDWIKDNGKFIPYPATWLNAKGWEDEISNPKYKDPYGSAVNAKEY